MSTKKLHTVRLLISLTPEVKERLIMEARKVYGNRRGAISFYLENLLRREFNMKLEGVDEF